MNEPVGTLVGSNRTIFSSDRKYRYTLWRDWFDDLFDHGAYAAPVPVYVMFIGLNPSTADETQDDPTIRRCKAFAKSWGYSAICMTNLFAWRATSPKDMKKVGNPVGEDNQHYLLSIASKAGLVIAAWGANGIHRQQDLTVRNWLNEIGVKLMCIRKTDKGHPEHPLYLPKDLKPIVYAP